MRGTASLLAVGCEAGALDVLHHQKREPIGGDAAIEQRNDVGMSQRREDLTLGPEAAQGLRSHAGRRHHLHGDQVIEGTIDAGEL